MFSPGVFWALSYGASSMAITLFNKAVLSEYAFKFPQVLTVCQGIFTLGCMYMLRAVGAIKFQDLNWKVARQVAPLSAVFIFYVVVSLAALGAVNVPMFTALRRTTLLFVMAFEYMSNGTVPSSWTLAASAVMTTGAMIAAAKDLSFDPVSYFYVFLTNLGTALYTVNIASVKKQHKLDIFTMLWYNNIMTMPVLAVLALLTGEAQAAMAFDHWADPSFLVLFGFSATLAFVLNYATYQSTSRNSPTTQSVIGQLKNFVAFVLSLILFSDYQFHIVNFTGLLIGFGGGVWYSVMQMGGSSKPAKPGEADEPAAADSATAPRDGATREVTDAEMEDDVPREADAEATARPRVLDGGSASRSAV